MCIHELISYSMPKYSGRHMRRAIRLSGTPAQANRNRGELLVRGRCDDGTHRRDRRVRGQTTRAASAPTAASAAVAGIVRIHATRMFRAVIHRTAASRRVLPAPSTAPDTTWVVLGAGS